MKNEKVKIDYLDGTSYDGFTLSGIYDGQGTIRWTNGAMYIGGWLKGKKHGVGEYKYPDGTVYKGDWKNDLYDGNGKLTFNNKSSYTGGFKESKFHGKGTLSWVEGIDFVDIHSVKKLNESKNVKNSSGKYSWTGQFVSGKIKKS